MKAIVIDPGHGGHEVVGHSTPYGARGPRNTLEKDVNLDVARRVVSHLGGAASLTRMGDDNLSLHARARRANELGAGAFVSIHANEGPRGSRGPELWVHDRASPDSLALASSLSRTLGARTQRGALAVLAPELLGACPGVLVETDYLSDPAGEDRLLDPRQLDQLGSSIAGGIHGYLGAEGAAVARAMNIPNAPPSNPGNFHFLSGGTWNHTTNMTFNGGQAMWFQIQNVNVLGTTLTITAQDGQSASSIILPYQTVDWVFASFGNEPMGWRFRISTSSSAFIVTWTLRSTWVEGMPPNR